MFLPNKHIAHLPLVNHTFDVYNATAQGVGFSSRPFRSDVLTVSESQKMDRINGLGVSGELGFGDLFQAGVNVNYSDGYVRSGIWSVDNVMDQTFKPNEAPGHLYEEVYFKKLGNRSGASSAFYTGLGGDIPLRQKIDEAGGNHKGLSSFISDSDVEDGVVTTHTMEGVSYRSERDLRNTNIQYLTADEATNYGLNQIENYTLNNFTYTSGSFGHSVEARFGTDTDDAKAHHLSEMTVLKGDGSRYVYGIPVVNKKTQEVMFNVSNKYPSTLGLTPLTADCKTGLINYSAGVENSTDNRRGDDNLYMKKKYSSQCKFAFTDGLFIVKLY